MADPLLNTLCTICHTNAPKYVCPGCSAQTCSLPCTKKHKSWANCSGRRDPTAFMPAGKLKTASGIDHDYNFLSAIERERDRNQRELVEERKVFTGREVRQITEDEAGFRKQWFGDKVTFDPVRRAGGGGSGGGAGPGRLVREDGQGSGGDDGDDDDNNKKNGAGGAEGPNIPARASYLTRQVRQRLDQAATQVVQMPTGMTRQRENTTSWNRKSRSINWCVEWMVYEGGEAEGKEEDNLKGPVRIRHKALEAMPLYRALGNSMAWYQRGNQQKGEDDDEDDEEEESAYARKRRRVLIREVKEEGKRSAMQDAESCTWAAGTPYPTQNPYAGGSWGLDRGASVTSWLPDEEIDARRGHRFYLLRPLTPAGRPKELIPVDPTETLSSALQGRTVLEYPAIYVLPPPSSSSLTAHSLPEGYVLGSTARREPVKRNNNNKSAKRRAADNKNDRAQQPPNKRQATGDGELPLRGPTRSRGSGAARGRGGRGGQQGRQSRSAAAQDGEEGEIDSDGGEVPRPSGARADPADTSSSDPDTSSDEDEEESADEKEGGTRGEARETQSAAAAAGKKTIPGLGLVEYGSDSDGSGGEEEDGEEDEDVDLAGLKPENPELVASAIKEIVGLLSS